MTKFISFVLTVLSLLAFVIIGMWLRCLWVLYKAVFR